MPWIGEFRYGKGKKNFSQHNLRDIDTITSK